MSTVAGMKLEPFVIDTLNSALLVQLASSFGRIST
jgi:hypothetical protein